MALFAEATVLFLKYKDVKAYDGDAGQFLPNDALHYFEHPEVGAKRILKDRLNMPAPELVLSFIESFKGMRGTWHMSFHWRTDMDKLPQLKPSEAVKSAEWFPLTQLPDRNDVVITDGRQAC